MSESAEVISNADASYGTDTETLPDMEMPNLNSFNEKPEEEKTSSSVIREAADNTQSCRVCYDEYHTSKNQARVLGCGHTFCTRCVISCSTPNDESYGDMGIKCPECRKISEQAPVTVPINFQLMQVLTALSLVKETTTPEQEKDLPQFENFDRLGAHIPVNELADLPMLDLFEHMKAVFNAIRLRADKDKADIRSYAMARYETEVRKIDEVERNMHRCFQNIAKLKNGDVPKLNCCAYLYPDRRSLQDTDWMREMVVFRPPNAPPNPLPTPAQPPVQDVDTVLEREQVARAEADPRRSMHVVREAHLRRERENAQERENANRNEQFMRQLLDRNEVVEDARLETFNWLRTHPPRLEERVMVTPRIVLEEQRRQESIRRAAIGLPPLLEHDDVTVEEESEGSISSDNSSFVEEPIPRPPPPPMTVGEAITIYRLTEVFSPRHLRQNPQSFILPRNYPNLDALCQDLLPATGSVSDEMNEEQLCDIQNYTRVNHIDSPHLLRCLRDHSVKFASTIVDSPRLTERRRRRQRPTAADDYNARLTIIRRRAKEALRGITPEQPIDGEESNLTIRLIVNLANLMGVREKLDDIICPRHRIEEGGNEVFVQKTNGSTRQEMLFCTLCRCDVPMSSRQVHSQGRRHVTSIANRAQSRQQQ